MSRLDPDISAQLDQAVAAWCDSCETRHATRNGILCDVCRSLGRRLARAFHGD